MFDTAIDLLLSITLGLSLVTLIILYITPFCAHHLRSLFLLLYNHLPPMPPSLRHSLRTTNNRTPPKRVRPKVKYTGRYLQRLRSHRERNCVHHLKRRPRTPRIITVYPSECTTDPYRPRRAQFHYGTDTVCVDNHSSCHISNRPDHFISPPIPFHGNLRGIDNNKVPIAGVGSVKWVITDDQGQDHVLLFHDVLYVPSAPACILSPQKWSQQYKTSYHSWCSTYHDRCILHWGDNQFQKTVFLDKTTNTPRFHLAPKYHEYQVLYTTLESKLRHREHVAFPAHLIEDDSSDTSSQRSLGSNSAQSLPPQPLSTPTVTPTAYPSVPTSNTPSQTPEFNNLPAHHFDPSSGRSSNTPTMKINIVEDDETELVATTPQAELLRWHYRLGHLSFNKILLLCKQGILPRSLASVQKPKCSACLMGAMHRKPWRTKAQPSKLQQTTAPGMCVSVDQLESDVPGFIGQMKGRLTRSRYKAATIFIDHFSDLGYVHLQTALTSKETLEAKKAFEAYARAHGVTIQHYHADNGRFADNLFINDVKASHQTISYCGAYAHFQNGKAEKRIRDLTESARTQLWHAISRWPPATSIHLWPYAIRHANDIRNSLNIDQDNLSPLEKFTGVPVAPNLKHQHTFACPVYALDRGLQSGKKIPKWNPRSRLGLYLGNSPRHSRSVSMVLSLNTGLVSPMYHVDHDDFFETVRPSTGNSTTHSLWQQLAGFVSHHKRQQESSTRLRGSSTQRQTEQEPSFILNPSETSTESPYPTDSPTDNPDELPSEPPHEQASEGDQASTNDEAQRSSRPRRSYRPSLKALENLQQQLENVAYTCLYEDANNEELHLISQMEDFISYAAKTNKDTLYYHQAMAAQDKDKFIEAMIKEVNGHIEAKHWELVDRSKVPPNKTVLPSVWSFKRKRDILTQEVYKWKARLNIHGGHQHYGRDYYETFSPVVASFTIRLLLILSLLLGWYSVQVDFVMAFPQAAIEEDMYMEPPHGIKAKGDKVIKLIANLYGQKQAGRVWYHHLVDGLEKIGYEKSAIDDCLYYRKDTMIFFHVDDAIILSPNKSSVDETIKQLKDLKFDIEVQGNISDYLGINFTRHSNGSMTLQQPLLIKQIISDSGLHNKAASKPTPAASTKILRRFEDDEKFDETRFGYRSIIGKLNFLEKSTRPDISYAVHQCARFSQDPSQQHGDAVIHIVRYLIDSIEKGLVMHPDKNKSFEVFVDADFSGNWFPSTAEHDSSTAKSRTGYVIFFAGCPILWFSKLQTQIALSTTEAEYIALSQALRDVIPLMQLLHELKERGFSTFSETPTIFCKAFEDNVGALELANTHKLRPRTKHINIVYHHFRQWVRERKINILKVSTEDQLADILTKPLPKNLFVKFRKKIMGW